MFYEMYSICIFLFNVFKTPKGVRQNIVYTVNSFMPSFFFLDHQTTSKKEILHAISSTHKEINGRYMQIGTDKRCLLGFSMYMSVGHTAALGTHCMSFSQGLKEKTVRLSCTVAAH